MDGNSRGHKDWVLGEEWRLKHRIEGERVFDQHGEPKGYIRGGKIYDREWKRRGI